MEGGCQVPIAGHAELNSNNEITLLSGLVASPNGKTIYKEQAIGQDPEQIGEKVAQQLINLGAKDLIKAVTEENESE